MIGQPPAAEAAPGVVGRALAAEIETATEASAEPELSYLAIEIPPGAPPRDDQALAAREEFVHGAALMATLVPPAPSRASPWVVVVLDDVRWLISEDGQIKTAGEDPEPLGDWLIDAYCTTGHGVFSDLRAQLAKRPGEETHRVLELVDTTELAINRRVADFLVAYEGELLATFERQLELAGAEAAGLRERYLADTPKAKADLASLREDLDLLWQLRADQLQYERVLAAARWAKEVLALPLAHTKLLLDTFRRSPTAEEALRDWDTTFGQLLREAIGPIVETPAQARRALLAASAAYLHSAQRRHRAIAVLWRELRAPPTLEVVRALIEEVTGTVERASTALLDRLSDTDDFRILLATTKPGRSITSRHVGPVPAAEAISDAIGLRSAPAPELAVAELLADRASSYEQLLGIVRDLPSVTVWDMDVVVAETRLRLGESGQIAEIEQAALRALDIRTIREQITDVGRDIVLTIAFGWVFGAASAVVIIAGAMLSVLDAMREYATYVNEVLLSHSDLLAPMSGARRLLTRDPSLLPLLASVAGAAGDLAAITRLPKLVEALEQAGLVLSLTAFTSEGLAVLLGDDPVAP